MDQNPRLCLVVQVWYIASGAESFLYPMSSTGVMHHYHRLSSSGNCLPVFRRPHITTAWSPPWQCCANSSACSVISGKHAFMYTFFMPKHLWRSQKWSMIPRVKRLADNILEKQRIKMQRVIKNQTCGYVWHALPSLQLMEDPCSRIAKIFDPCA